ncbi:hypothetical protein JQX13_13685 [Archangium violaceum]|uniref:hypothetical protein n=1 Tax=Archangium violaceum TaxID=83451 RepID=UPI00193BB470|nr:hypothetical protein [Archangium violaceum]QRK11022.1 hypothetical protein JQX13_13685 [Archangium violaceum]
MTTPGRPTHPNSQPSDSTPTDGTATGCPQDVLIRRENVLFVGSESDYDSFWLKMMFIAAAYVLTRGGLRSADKNTLAYVDIEYTRHEKLALDYLREKAGFHIVKLASSGDIVNHINTRPESLEGGKKVKLLLQDVAFFSHGVPGAIKLNFRGPFDTPAIDFSASELSATRKDAFVPDGRIYSYACRTGVSVRANSLSSDSEAGMENSLAQKMADHYKVQVHAFLRRSFYGSVLREKSTSLAISEALKEARKTQEGQVIELPPEHQALPHPGLADGLFSGAVKEGTSGYSLWRKAGGIELPSTGQTPEGLSAGMHVFTPRSSPS